MPELNELQKLGIPKELADYLEQLEEGLTKGSDFGPPDAQGIAGTPVVSAGGTLVFEWNGTDTSQFEDTAAFADGSAAATLSVGTDSERGNYLRLLGTAGTSACIVFLAKDALPFVGTRRDALLEMELLTNDGQAGGYSGIVYMADNESTYHGMSHYTGGVAEWANVIEDASRANAGGTGNGIGENGGFVEYRLTGDNPSGVPPHLSSFAKGFTANSQWAEPRRSGSSRGAINPMGADSALGSSWDNLACDRWGLTLQSSGANSLVNVSMDILTLKIYLLGC